MIVLACPLQAAALQRFDIAAQPLADALAEVGRKAGINLLFDPRIVAGASAGPIHGQMSVDDALGQLLGPSGLEFDHTTDGAILIKAHLAGSIDARPAAVPEILIVGRRALNVDLVRSENDIQPYEILNAQTIEEAGAQSLDAVLKTRLPSNAQALLSTQVPLLNNGSTRSQVDLRGLGADQTLILLDGHRLPSFPELDQFGQSDINGIPLNAIERVEVLPSTAGGIYGPGASGGVINIVLKHDASGFDLSGSRGISARGDAPNWRFQAHAGFTRGDGDTKGDIFYEHSEDAGLSVGDRSYVVNAAEKRFANLIAANPSGDIQTFAYGSQFFAPYSKSINFISNTPLYFSPAFGGGPVGSNFTFIPLADIGTPQEADILRANAGKLDFSLPDTGTGLRQSLLTATQRDGTVLTVRQRITDNIDLFLDATAFREVGDAVGGLQYGPLDAGPFNSPGSPIDSASISLPPVANTGFYSTRTMTAQVTAGIVASLGGDWQAETDLTVGTVTTKAHFPAAPDGLDNANPFAGAASLAAFEKTVQLDRYISQHASDRLLDGNIRLAGPLLRLPSGPLSLTILGEARSDRTGGIEYGSPYAIDFTMPSQENRNEIGGYYIDSAGQHLSDLSLYAEVRAPLVAKDSDMTLLRGLELQAAARVDRLHRAVSGLPITILSGGDDGDDDDDDDDDDTASSSVQRTTFQRTDTMAGFTLGAKMEPIAGLTLRTSIATGSQPADTSYLQYSSSFRAATVQLTDPKRDDETTFPTYNDGAAILRPSRYRSLLIGGILVPRVLPSLRVSIDYSHIGSKHEVFSFPQPGGVTYYDDPGFFLGNEDALPGRVVRAPLTAADAAKGYTAGVVTFINGAAASSGSSRLDSIDFSLRDELRTGIGSFALSGKFSWILDFRRKTAPYEPSYSVVGYLDGPAAWKGNAELDWSRGAVGAGANVQLFAAYRGATSPEVIAGVVSDYAQADAINFLLEQDSAKVPPQAYVDTFVSVRVRGAGAGPSMLLRLSCQNLLDKKPPFFSRILTAPFESNFGLGYSYYGDPRGRRFLFEVSTSF